MPHFTNMPEKEVGGMEEEEKREGGESCVLGKEWTVRAAYAGR